MMEFTLAFVPLLMMIFVLMDATWAMYRKSTLAAAVRAGLRVGITMTGAQTTAAGSDLTGMVKSAVQGAAGGLLGSASTDPGYALIKVHYFKPPDVLTSATPTDVCAAGGNAVPGNIIQVSVQGYSVRPLVARIFSLNKSPDGAATSVSAVAADLIEPSRDPPPIGAAP